MTATLAPASFLWHDYETFGADPRRDRPAQFAGIRTDLDLNEIGEPFMHYCRPAPDYLPDPQSCLITGITPQQCMRLGIPEHQFASTIVEALGAPGTIGVGYNTIRFDDEVTRFLLWRNLRDPYAREWQNRCGRWDILDMVRAAYALRPEGIEWPVNDEGHPSFRLEHLTASNGISHIGAHDALSDVRATIALARLIRQRQPRLFDFCLGLRKKERVAEEIGWPRQRPLLHVSGMIPPERGCIAFVWPLAMHPTNRNEVIVWDLNEDPTQLLSLDAAAIRLRMFTRTDDLPPGVDRLPIKTIHLNRSPIVIGNVNTLTPQMAERWGMNIDVAQKHADLAVACGLTARMTALWAEIFQRPPEPAPDVDEDLYGAFVSNSDRALLERLHLLSPADLAAVRPGFQDFRLEELLFRYRARNFPETLSGDEKQRWHEHCAGRVREGTGGVRTLQTIAHEIGELMKKHPVERDRAILSDVADYAASLMPASDAARESFTA